jgi:hypothetical protein
MVNAESEGLKAIQDPSGKNKGVQMATIKSEAMIRKGFHPHQHRDSYALD